jgi:hypothetical protein
VLAIVITSQRKATLGRGRTYINRDEDIQPVMLGPHLGLVIVLLCCVMAYYKRVFGEFGDVPSM